MTNSTARYHELVSPLTGAVAALVSATLTQLEDHKLPAADSSAMEQLHVEASIAVPSVVSNPITDALVTIGHYIAAGCDHLRLMCTTYDADPPVLFGDRTLLRAAIEAYARASWLSDPMTAQERARRTINERLASLTDQIEFTKAAGSGLEREREHLRRRRETLVQGCCDRGYGDIGQKNGQVWLGRRRPSPTAVIKWFAEDLGTAEDVRSIGGLLQRSYSGFTHSSLWALRSAIVTDDRVPPRTTARNRNRTDGREC